MMENSKSEGEKIINDIRKFFKLKKEVKGIKDIVLGNIKKKKKKKKMIINQQE